MDRQRIFDKYGGKCAFCGIKLLAGWHVWDIEPIATIVNPDGGLVRINTEEDNLMPACKECGSVRIKNASGKMDIERFRREIISMYLFCRDGAMYSSSIRRAIKFGLIKEIDKEIVFHFEKVAAKKIPPQE